MTNDLRVVVDTNVLISGIFSIRNSPSSKILDAVRQQKITLVTSPQIIEEVGEVLNRPRIAKLLNMNEEERKVFLDSLIARSDVTVGKQLEHNYGRDSKDDKFLACGVEGGANYIITGDRDLLDVTEYADIKIITPREFIELIGI